MQSHIKIKILKTKYKDKMLKGIREKWNHTCGEKKLQMTVDFASKTMEAKRKWHYIFQILPKTICYNPES